VLKTYQVFNSIKTCAEISKQELNTR
jgi:hypothetical protein